MDIGPHTRAGNHRPGRAWALVAALLATALAAGPAAAGAATLPGFKESVVFSGLDSPTALRFSPDGRVFVAEKSGLIDVFDSVHDTTPTVFADLRTEVYNYWDRGLLGIELDPQFPAKPYVYALYSYDAEIGGQAPLWGEPGSPPTTVPRPRARPPTGAWSAVAFPGSRPRATG